MLNVQMVISIRVMSYENAISRNIAVRLPTENTFLTGIFINRLKCNRRFGVLRERMYLRLSAAAALVKTNSDYNILVAL